jgi:hypothetical protein
MMMMIIIIVIVVERVVLYQRVKIEGCKGIGATYIFPNVTTHDERSDMYW